MREIDEGILGGKDLPFLPESFAIAILRQFVHIVSLVASAMRIYVHAD